MKNYRILQRIFHLTVKFIFCLLYTSDAADKRSSVDLGGRRIIKKKNTSEHSVHTTQYKNM